MKEREIGKNRLGLKLNLRGILTLAFALTLALAFALTLAFTFVSYAGIVGSKHDLSSAGTGTIKAVSETQKCVFCHTPHHSSTAGPLWNRNLSAQIYTVPTTTQFPDLLTVVPQPDRGSKLCLSCHDGTVAIGLLINTPGPGTIYPSLINMSGVTGEGKMPCSPTDPTCFGTDLSSHHPVSIAYNTPLYNAKAAQCNSCESDFLIKPPAEVAPPVRLMPTDNTYGGEGGLGVQCASCHDPHNNPYGNFLVMDYYGTTWLIDSENLCLKCHELCTAICG